MQSSEKMHIRLPPEIKKWLEQEAVRNDRSMNNQVVSILREKMQSQDAAKPDRIG